MVSWKGSLGEDDRLIEADHQGIVTASDSSELTFNAVVDDEGVFRLADIQNRPYSPFVYSRCEDATFPNAEAYKIRLCVLIMRWQVRYRSYYY